MIASETSFYVTGGTLQRDTPSYVERQADTDLYTALRQGEFCYVLTSRQMGKSSLMVRTAARLREAGIAVVTLELTGLGQNLSAEQWYDGLLASIAQELDLEAEVEQFWLAHARLSPLQRWLRALREVLLGDRDEGRGMRDEAETASPHPSSLVPHPSRLVICLDEIDAVRSLPFSTDEFFAAIRECYNRRAEDPALQRLTFCLLGVATPSDLIQDTRTTPFNIGKRIELTDFTEAEAAPLALGLIPTSPPTPPLQGEVGLSLQPGIENAAPPSLVGKGAGGLGPARALLQRILYWTGGHPYLTQRLCQAVAEANPKSKTQNRKAAVDRCCAELFLSPGAREQDNNLLFVRELLLRSTADPASLLTLYRQVRSGRRVRADETNPLVSSLRLSGIVRLAARRAFSSSAILRVRNRIYGRVFDPAWVAQNMPDAERRRQRAAFRKGLLRSGSIAGLVVAVIGGLALSAARERDRVSRLLYVADMNVAQQALSEGNVDRAGELLAEHRPGKGSSADLRGFEWRYLWRLCQEGALAAFHGNGGPVLAVAYSPDGQTLAALNEDGSVNLWELATRTLAAEFPAPEPATGMRFQGFSAGCLAFSPDGKLLAVGGEAVGMDAPVTLWDLATRRKVAAMPEAPARELAFSPDGKLLAEAGYSSTGTGVFSAGLLDVATQQAVTALRRRRPLCSALSPDGTILALADVGSAVEFWNVATKRPVAWLRPPRDWAWEVRFSPDGKTLATCARDKTVRLWDRATRRVAATLPAPRSSTPLARGREETGRVAMLFSPDSRKLATVIGDANVVLWDLVRKKKLATLPGHKQRTITTAFAPDGETLATGSMDGTIKLWSTVPEGEGATLGQPAASLLSLAFSPDGKTLAAGSADGALKLYDTASRREIASPPGHRGAVRAVAFSPDGKLLASAGSDRTVRLWRVAFGRQVAALTGHKDQVSCLAFSANGKTLASGGEDGTVQLWDVATNRRLALLETGAGVVLALAFSPDGKTLALGTNEYSVKLWDLAAREEVASLLAHTSSVTAVAFSPDGKTLASGSADHNIELWDVAARQPRAVLKGCKERVKAVSFSPDSKTLASGSEDGTVRLWNVATGREAVRLGGQQGAVSCVAFSPDGTSLAAGGTEGGVRLWHAASFADIDAQERSAAATELPASSRSLILDDVQRRMHARAAR